MSRTFSLLLLFLALGGGTAHADDYKWPDPCDDLQEVKGVKDLRESKTDFDGKVEKMRAATTALKADCDAYRSNPQQAGKRMSQLRQHQQEAGQAGVATREGGATLKEKIGTISGGLQKLGGGTSCSNNLRALDAGVDSIQNRLKTDVEAACAGLNTGGLDDNYNHYGEKADRAKRAGELVAGSDTTKKASDVEAAINDPKKNRAMSKQLLDEADAYAKAHGLPSPKKGSGDTICGEACVSVLRARAAETQYGADSWQYRTYHSTAKVTKPSLFGTVYDPYY